MMSHSWAEGMLLRTHTSRFAARRWRSDPSRGGLWIVGDPDHDDAPERTVGLAGDFWIATISDTFNREADRVFVSALEPVATLWVYHR